MNQVYLFTGLDQVEMEKGVTQWRDKYLEKFGDAQIYEIDLTDEQSTIATLLPILAQNSLFQEKQLVILKGFPSAPSTTQKKKMTEEEEELLWAALQKTPEETIIVLVSPNPDKRKKKTTQIFSMAKVKEYPWDSYVREDRIRAVLSGKIPSSDMNMFFEILPDDSLSLHAELQKLRACFGDSKFTFAEAKHILHESTEFAAFRIFDSLAQGNRRELLTIIRALVLRGEDIHKLLGLIIWHGDLLFWVYHAKKNGFSKSETAEILGVKPFSLENPWKLVGDWNSRDLDTMITTLAEVDRGLKNGAYTKELEDPALLSDLLFRILMDVQPSARLRVNR